MKNSSLDRRQFLTTVLAAGAALPVLGSIASSLTACTKGGGEAPPAGETALTESDAVATALGYSADASKVDVVKFPKKATGEQACSGCAQYTSVNGGWGRCNIFPGKVVTAKGWCNSWVAKPAG